VAANARAAQEAIAGCLVGRQANLKDLGYGG
jgi:hypothetical protein